MRKYLNSPRDNELLYYTYIDKYESEGLTKTDNPVQLFVSHSNFVIMTNCSSKTISYMTCV